VQRTIRVNRRWPVSSRLTSANEKVSATELRLTRPAALDSSPVLGARIATQGPEWQCVRATGAAGGAPRILDRRRSGGMETRARARHGRDDRPVVDVAAPTQLTAGRVNTDRKRALVIVRRRG
jgi:hypothetical protein